MHALFLAGLILPFAIMLAMIFMLGKEMKAFLAELPVMRTAEDLARFKRLAARSMYGALVQIVLFIVPWAVYLFGLSKQALAQGEVTIIFLLSIATFLAILSRKKDEDAVRSIRTEDIEMKIERDKVAKTWMQKLWPDW
ncbi:MAG: hypothetical protein ACYDCO_25730 [Armatimonadota bacterium]